MALVLVLATALTRCAPLAAQDSTSWRASASYGFEAFTESRTPWHMATLGVTRRSPRLTAIGEADAYRRFDITDYAAVADVYTVFRRGTYANWRVHAGPNAEVVARVDAGVELYQATGRGFELSAGYRHASYTNSDVDLVSASAAKYTGNWYLRARGGAAFQGGATGYSLGLLARRILGTSDDLAEVQGGFGKEIVILAPGSVALAPTAFVAARWQRYYASRWGLSVTGSWNHQEGIPDRAGLTFGLMRGL